MSEKLYTEVHYRAFLDKLSEAHISVLSIITDNNLIPKKDIISLMSENYSKNPVVAAIDALLFAGLISFEYSKRQHKFFLSDDGKAFTEYVAKQFEEENSNGSL
ncbi:hypothetical protein [Paenibacillus taichungensis]|uniref:hypothetical protein n=1 Tax=Paenibacillus taichungensis TaxID=484184 RepID=UPI0038CF3909